MKLINVCVWGDDLKQLKAEGTEGACIPLLAKASHSWQHRWKKTL